MNNKGFFLAIEGPDGSGKTTISKKLIDLLEQKSIPCILTREPGCNNIDTCKNIRQLILDNNSNISPITEALLFAANRSEHVEKIIRPGILNNNFIICDRYIDSSIAYQGFGRNLGYESVMNINLFATNNLLPNLTIFIDIDPVVGIKRIKSNRNQEINRLDNETIDFHQKVYNGYLEIIKKNNDRYVIINGEQDIDNIINEIIKEINNVLKKGDYFINEI